MTTDKKTAPEGATSETANEQVPAGSDTRLYLPALRKNTKEEWGTLSGTLLSKENYRLAIVSLDLLRYLANVGEQSVVLNPKCLAENDAEVRRQEDEARREKEAAESRARLLCRNRIVSELREGEFDSEMEAAENTLWAAEEAFNEVEARVQARADEILQQEGVTNA